VSTRSILCIAFALLASSSAADDPASLVKYRQSVMKAMGAHMTAMSLIVKKQVAGRGRLAAHAAAVRGTSEGLADLFPPGTGSDRVRTAATEAVWKQRSEFAAAAQKLQRESAKLVAAAKAGDARAFDAQFESVGAACSECHKRFRARDSQ
jgi:cytochrome c556